MNYQQWKSLLVAPIGKTVAVNTGGYIFPGTFYFRPDMALYCVGPYGKIYEYDAIETWSWSETEPVAEMLMVKPHGIFCAHWWNEIGHLLNIIQDFDVKMFVEIGTLDGGLSSLLIDRISYFPDFQYIGINLGLQYTDPRVMEKIANTRGAVLQDADAWNLATVEWVIGFIADQKMARKRAMIYCDGGNKPREAHLYWPILRPGDLLGVHDYSDDPNSKGPEVYPADVSDIIAAGKRIGQDALADTRILLVEKT